MAKKKKKASKWIDTSAFKDGWDLGDGVRTVVRSAKKSSKQITKQAKKAAANKKKSIKEDTLNFIASGNSHKIARNIVTGSSGIGVLSELFDSKLGQGVKTAEGNIDSALKTSNKDEKRSYFRRGLFEDGYDFGDVTKTLLGTNKDFTDDIGTGVAKIGEGLIDTVAYGVGAAAKGLGNDKFADKTKDFISRDLVGETNLGEEIGKVFPGVSIMGAVSDRVNKGKTEEVSVLGDKSDALAQSAGQLGGTIGLQAVGVPWWLTTGVTGFGSGTEEAFKNDATYGEAGVYGGISAGSEIIFEKLSGGIKFGGRALDEGLKRKLSDVIANKTLSSLAKFGLDAVGEGTEEVLTEITQNIGKKLTYEDEKTWNELLTSEEAMDGYIESFVGGAVLGGGMSGAGRIKASKTGRDYDTGLTDHEQSVVNAEVESRATEQQKKSAVESEVNRIIEERQKTVGDLTETEKKNIRKSVESKLDSGELDFTTAKLSAKERTKIEKQVREDLENGYIGVDSIESTLAKEKTARIKELQQQLESVAPAKKAEIEAEINQLKLSRATQMKGMLSKDNYLQESYKQELLKSKEFEREVTDKDSDITKELIESAKNSKMNNTRKMHDLFEYTNKIANDSKTKYGFVNNEQLKELGYEAEGASINGLVRVDKDGATKVLINTDSDKAINTIIGHETTHLLEDANEYKALQNIVKEYATTKGDYDGRLKQITKLYEGTNANIENEVTADLVGDYLFTDEQFINSLSTKEPNVFKKVYDYIKHAYKMATAGSKEARQLEQVKRSFDKAYKQISKTTTQEVKDNSLTEADSNTGNVRQDYDNSEDKTLYQYIKDALAGKLSKKSFHKLSDSISDRLANDIEKIVGFSVKGYGNEISPGNIRHIDKEHGENGSTDQSMSDVHDLAKVGYVINNYDNIREGKGSREYKNSDGSQAKTVELQKKIDEEYYYVVEAVPDAKLKTLHVVSAYKNKNDTFSEEAVSKDPSRYVQDEPQSNVSSENMIPTKEDIVNGKQSRSLTKEQEEYFKDSKVRDENGNLKVMYHGTSAGGHTVFDPYGKAKYGLFGMGSYFTDNKSVAESYTEKGKGNNKQIYETYLNITNPIDMDAAADPEAWSKALPGANFPTEGTNEDFYRAMEEYFEDQEYSRWEASEAALETLEGMGYDGITHIGGGRFNKKDETRHQVYIAFQPEQVKNIDNTSPTADPDIRYSLSKKGTVVDNTGNEVELQATATGTHNDLIAVHNLTADKLKATLKLGAFPMPSIAVTNLPHNNFGDISILFGKETIDPKANKDNKVYSADAWTPTVPKVEYEADSNVLHNASAKFYNVRDKMPSEYTSRAGQIVGTLEDRLQNYGTEEAIVESLKNEYSMKSMFLADKGETVVQPTKEIREDKTPNPLIDDTLALFEEDIETLSKTSLKELREKYVDSMREVLLSHGRTEAQAEKMLEAKGGVFGFGKYMSRILNYARKPEFTVRTETDIEAMQNDIDSRVDDAEYTAWLQNLVSGIVKDSGLYNGKDIFTPSGNRRSFKATHYPVTVENIVRAMKNEGEKNVSGFNGVKTLRAVTAKSFKSIDEIRKDKGKLQNLTQEEADRISDELQSKLYDIITNIKELNPKRTTGNTFIDSDNVGSMIQEMAAADMNADQMVNEFESLGYNIDGSIPTDLEILFDAIKNMPVYIFEAKPRRVVGFDEIQAVVIPNDTDTGLKQELSDRDLYVVEYDPNIEEDRQNKINQFDNLKFSLSSRNDDIAPIRDDYKALTEKDIPYVEQQGTDALNSITDDMAPIVTDDPVYEEDDFEPENPLEADGRDIKDVGKRNVKAYMYENPEVKPFFQEEAAYMLNDLKNSVKGQKHFNDQLYYESSGEQGWYGTKRETSEEIAYLLDEFNYSYADLEKGLNAIIEDHGAENNAISKRIEFMIDERLREGYEDMMYGDTVPPNEEYINLLREKQITEYSDEAYEAWVRSLADVEAPIEPITQGGIDYIRNLSREAGIDTADVTSRYGVGSLEEMSREQYMDAVNWLDQMAIAPVRIPEAPEDIAPIREDIPEVATDDIAPIRDDIPISQGVQQEVREDGTIGDVPEDIPNRTRRELQRELLAGESNYIIKALEQAKNLPMALMNNTDTIRNNEMVLGRDAGKKINEAIFQKAIDNEARSIYWQNKQRADIKALGIKARSKESAAVQKFGEGEYVNEFGDLVQYGEADLMMEFPDEATQEKIKEAARIIKIKYEHYIDKANEVLTGLGFDPIPKRKNYMRHFQELSDVFSKNGIPFNPQSMQEHVLPTDINGLTEFWSPQKNYFANIQPRKGKRTTLDAITGIDGYLGGIANLIFHTEDIQRGRAYENMIRENFGEDRGWDIVETLPQEDQAPRAELIENNHLSNYAAWVHEWTNNIAGKKHKVDRAAEALFGRRGFSFLDGVRKQVGANMIGFNVASSLTNLISPLQAMAKTNKIAVMKGTVDTFRNIVSKDDFVDKNAFLTARFGTDMLSKTRWEKWTDRSYMFMKGIDHFSSNLIVRSKYNELIKKGMSEKQAHAEAGKFAARIMGDRTKGANAQLYNSKIVGVLTQFQLEVNNQLYSMFYDTYHDSKENAKGNAAKMAAGMTFTLGQLFAFTHIFGKGFENLAGYNPTFDVFGILATLFGIGEDEEEEKTLGERTEAAMQQLVKSLPYTSVFTGGRIPIGQALPIKQLFTGEDQYGNEKSRLATLAETAPYYLMPGGYGQIKKTAGGVGMFMGDKPVAGSYTDSGNLRFPVEETPMNVVHAAIFGKWANKNAQDYIDNERMPLKEKQIQEYKDLDMPIKDYWDIREGLAEQKTLEDKFDYIADLNIPVRKKNIMINNIVDREDRVDLGNYGDFSSYEEFDFATKYPEKYSMSKVVGFDDYMMYTDDLWNIRADKDQYGNSIRGTRQEKVIDYINGLDIDYEAKLILYKREYNSDDAHNQEIIDYLNNRDDISYQDMEAILTDLGFEVGSDGTIYW